MVLRSYGSTSSLYNVSKDCYMCNHCYSLNDGHDLIYVVHVY